jgi:hypothetical protein
MKYFLEDVELWSYDFESYPKLVIDIFFDKYIGKEYSFEEFIGIEDEIREYLVKSGFFVTGIMNPFYADRASTVITCDLTKVVREQMSREEEKNEKFRKVYDLLEKHEKITQAILKNGGLLAMEKNNGCYFSKDVSLYKIEQEITESIRNNFLEVMSFLKDFYSLDLLKALQWVPKDGEVLDLIVKKIREGDEEEKNSCLFQLMPIMDVLDVELQKRLFDLFVNETLLAPTSKVRNKVFSLMLKMPSAIILTSSIEFQKFLRLNATSKQLNCSYPVREIIKTLGS